jgi:hypothetical protein
VGEGVGVQARLVKAFQHFNFTEVIYQPNIPQKEDRDNLTKDSYRIFQKSSTETSVP